MGTLHDTADAVKELIDAGAYSKDFDIELAYDTELLLEDAGTLQVIVVAAGLEVSVDSRYSLAYECSIDIAVRYRFGTDETDDDGKVNHNEVEAYLNLLEEIGEHLADPDNRVPSRKTLASWIGNDIRMPYVPDHIRNQRQYTGILRARYRVDKEYS